MKLLEDYIDESLIKSYDTDSLKRKLTKKYNISKFHDNVSKSDNPNRFSFELQAENDEILKDEYVLNEFMRLLDFYGYYVTEIKYVKDENVYDVHLEPIFGKKCNDLVYDKCNGVIWHVTSENYINDIRKKGLKPFEGNRYRVFTERVFFSCGETTEEIIKNLTDIIKQLGKRNVYILKINLNNKRNTPYKANFYYDPSEDNIHNYVCSNAVFFPSLIEEEYISVKDVKEDLESIIEQRIIGNHKLIVKKV